MSFLFRENVCPPLPEKPEILPHSMTDTRLTFYLSFETWTPEQAALLIVGVMPLSVDSLGYTGTGKVMNLAGRIIDSDDPLSWAKIILTQWNGQENPPAKVRPVDFVAWCETKNINTGWITGADEWVKYKAFHLPKPNVNNMSISDLLNVPERQDDWWHAISEATRDFYKEFRKLPSTSQLWGQLHQKPPHGYMITSGKDKGEDCLCMPGVNKPLSRSAFNKRWDKYTANKPQ